MGNLTQIHSLVQFSRGSKLVWDVLTEPIPNHTVVFSVDDGIFKLGDGVSTYQMLPTLFAYSGLVAAQGGTSSLFDPPILAQNDMIVTVQLNTNTGAMEYAASGTTLTGLLAMIDAIEATNTSQDAAVASILTVALSLDVSINTGADNSVVVINNGRFANSGQTVAQVQAAIIAANTANPGPHLDEPVFYTTSDKSIVVDKSNLSDNTTYYVDVIGFHDNTDTPVYGCTCARMGVDITQIGSTSLFALQFITLANNTNLHVPVILQISIDDGTGMSKAIKAVSATVWHNQVLVSIYGGISSDNYRGVVSDKSGNIICAGVTNSEGSGSPTYSDILIVKYDPSFNILARKIYGGSLDDQFYAVAVDSSNNIICAGYTASEGTGGDALVVKFDSNLNIVARKRYGGTGGDGFNSVAVDSSNNIICVGYTYSEGAGNPTYTDALVVKFDSNLNILARKIYGGTGGDGFYSVAVDSSNNIICVGYTNSEGAGNPTYTDALVVKLNANLNILARKRYGGTSNEKFQSVAVDSSGNIICVGASSSEGTGSPTYNNALIVKYDSNLNILVRKAYSGANHDYFQSVAVDSSDNIICVGYTYSEGTGSPTYADALVVKFDTNLNILARKIYGGTSNDVFYSVSVYSNNIICAGYTSTGVGSSDALIMSLPASIPSGTFIGSNIPLTLTDSMLTLTNSNLTFADSNLTLAASNLTLADSTLTLKDSILSQNKDALN